MKTWVKALLAGGVTALIAGGVAAITGKRHDNEEAEYELVEGETYDSDSNCEEE